MTDGAVKCSSVTLKTTYQLPATVVDAVRALDAILDEADEYCLAGKHLLTLATPPDLVTFRRWYLDGGDTACDRFAGFGGGRSGPAPWRRPADQ